MRIMLLMYIIILLPNIIISQIQSNWIPINSIDGVFSFQIPNQPDIYNVANNVYYYCNVDSIINIHINYVTIDTSLNPNEVLDVFSRSLILVTEGELVSTRDTILQGQENIKGREVGVKYIQNEVEYFTFSLIYYWQNKFVSFTISAKQTDLVALINYKTLFINSILINN